MLNVTQSQPNEIHYLFGAMDGHSVAFSGDNIFPLWAGTPSLIYRNHVHKTRHQQTARLYQEYAPDILCTGHDLQREVRPQVYAAFAQKALLLTQKFEALLPGEANFGLEPSWTQIYPYQSWELSVRVRLVSEFHN